MRNTQSPAAQSLFTSPLSLQAESLPTYSKKHILTAPRLSLTHPKCISAYHSDPSVNITRTWGEKERVRRRLASWLYFDLIKRHAPLRSHQSICWWHLVSQSEMRAAGSECFSVGLLSTYQAHITHTHRHTPTHIHTRILHHLGPCTIYSWNENIPMGLSGCDCF